MKNLFVCALALVCFAGVTHAGGGNVLSLNQVENNVISVNLDTVDVLQGWSWGICNAPETMATDVADGTTTATVNNGSPPDFNTINIFAEGWSVGAVISFLGAASLPAGTGLEMNVATYDVSGLSGASDVCTCDATIGSPATANVLVVDGQSIAPAGADGACASLEPGPPPYVVSLDASGLVVTISLDSSAGADVQGWSWGVCNDETQIQPLSVADGSTTATVNGGSPPDFNTINTFANGWSVGVVISFLGTASLPPGSGYEMNIATYEATGIQQGEMTDVCMCDNTIGSPPTANVIVVAGQSVQFGGFDACVTLEVALDPPFVRGDCNDDGGDDIADGIYLINNLFLGGPDANCPAACDANSDGLIDASDATFLWNYLLLDGPPPAAPFPGCGPGGADPADCSSNSC